MKSLIKAGANLHQKTAGAIGVMPLHLAAQSLKINVRFLVRSGAEVDSKDNRNQTPFNRAQMFHGDCCTECLREMEYLKL